MCSCMLLCRAIWLSLKGSNNWFTKVSRLFRLWSWYYQWLLWYITVNSYHSGNSSNPFWILIACSTTAKYNPIWLSLKGSNNWFTKVRNNHATGIFGLPKTESYGKWPKRTDGKPNIPVAWLFLTFVNQLLLPFNESHIARQSTMHEHISAICLPVTGKLSEM
jgi:hypothetical protein